MRQHQVVPLAQEGNVLTVAMVNPNNLVALDDIKFRVRNVTVQPLVCTEDDFQHFMETIYRHRQDEIIQQSEEEANQTFIESEVDLSNLDVMSESEDEINDLDLAKQAQDAPIVLLANQILAKAIKKKCSDIHLEPQDKCIIVRYRLDGVLFID